MNKEIVARLVESAKNAMPAGISADKWVEMYNERLIELVVRECACVADDMKSLGAAQAIKEHFGV